tara:strand:+ start:1166 stop:1954 length:789 start_codon:yes stop_codon:yes gene_type:complete
MKNFITALFLTVGFAVTAQVANITYVSVDRENSETFLELHQKFANLSISDDRKITGGGMFAHAFAGDYTFAIYDFYANEQDLVNDPALADAAMQANVEALNLDDTAKEALMAEYQSYVGMYVHNHSDQIRQSRGLEDMTFEAEGLDWSTKKVVVVSTYNTKWGKNKDFVEGIKNGSLKTLKESGLAVAAYASRHFYGSGADWQTYQVYNTWSDFAAYEEANLGGPMTEDDKKFWSAINSHSDEILTYIGGMDPETKVFSYSK